jgi:hypothetical protein
MGLRRSQFVLSEFAVRESARACSRSQASAFSPRLNLVLHEEPIEMIAKPHIEAGVVEAGHFEIDLAVIEALKDAHSRLFLADEKPTAIMPVKSERRDGYGLCRLAIRRRDDAEDMGARPHDGDAPAELGRGRGFRLVGHVPEGR